MKRYLLAENRPQFTLWLIISAYVIVFSALSIWKLNHFYYDNLDLAIFNQVFWNTAFGAPFAASIHPPTFLADHFMPMILVISLLYRFTPGPEFLLVFQTVIIGLTAIPIYYIARQQLRNSSRWLPLLPVAAWLLNPIVHNMNFFEFHLLPLAVLFIFSAVFAYLTERRLLFIIFFVLALLVREDVSLILFFFGIVAAIERKSFFWIVFPMVTSVLYAAFSFPLIASFNGADVYKFSIYYGWLGGTSLPSIIVSFISHPIQLIGHLLTITNIEMILGLLFPIFFIVSLRSPLLLFLVPPLAQVLLGANGGGALIIQTHYGGFLLIGVLLSFIHALKRIEANRWPRVIPTVLHKKEMLYGVIVTATVYGALTYGVITPVVLAWGASNQEVIKQELVSSIPRDASVASTFELLTPLSSREHIYSLHYALIGKNQFALTDYALPDDTEFIAVDWNDMVKAFAHFQSNDRLSPYAERVPGNISQVFTNFGIVYADGSVMLLERDAKPFVPASIDADIRRDSAGSRVELASQSEHSVSLLLLIDEGETPLFQYVVYVETPARTFSLPLAYGVVPYELKSGAVLMDIFIPEGEREGSQITLRRYDEGAIRLGDLRNIKFSPTYEDVSSIELTR